MSEWLAAAASALWLGILTSISPCPLASNVAAVSAIARHVDSPGRVWVSGALYSLGRAATYVAVGFIVVSSVLSAPAVSMFLQREMNRVLGPLLILVGLFLLLRLRLPGIPVVAGHDWLARAGRKGPWGAALLGVVFALSFCPVSAGLFFGSLLPLAVASRSPFLLPLLYGIGTGLPVVGAAIFLAGGTRALARGFEAMTRVERLARPVSGAVFILAGVYLTAAHWMPA
jgi:cytochrome c biogenesis protein CcdA